MDTWVPDYRKDFQNRGAVQGPCAQPCGYGEKTGNWEFAWLLFCDDWFINMYLKNKQYKTSLM
ncbi:hypothetical protein AVEN_52670-1, partial [Araneus ventricosus]